MVVTPELLTGILVARTTANTWDSAMQEYSIVFPTLPIYSLFHCYGDHLFVDGFDLIAPPGCYLAPDFHIPAQRLQMTPFVSSTTPPSGTEVASHAVTVSGPVAMPFHVQPGAGFIHTIQANDREFCVFSLVHLVVIILRGQRTMTAPIRMMRISLCHSLPMRIKVFHVRYIFDFQ